MAVTLALRRTTQAIFAALNPIIDPITGLEEVRWSRVVMLREAEKLVQALQPETLTALEISGGYWCKLNFKSYRTVHYPDYDVCEKPLPEKFDLIIADQIFEHLLWPYRAGRHVLEMLNPGGHFLVLTPFLVRVHNFPTDCSRWTETGLKYFLAECGFPLEDTVTGSWGNRYCVMANYVKWLLPYRPRIHSLKNNPDYPVHVWALAHRPEPQP